MKPLFFLATLITSFASFGQERDCARFRNGTFIIDDQYAQVIVKRKGNIQIEQTRGQKHKARLQVNWIDDCTYTLKATRKTLKQSGTSFPPNALVTVTILETKPNSYIQRTTSNFVDIDYVSEMKLKD